jgi:invasion protein IalB
MTIVRSFPIVMSIVATAFVFSPALAQQSNAPRVMAQAKPTPAKPTRAPARKPAPAGGPTLLGQFGDWGAYVATPGGRKVCFALSKPLTAVTDPPGRKRDQPFAFVSTRPSEKVKDEVSITFGYPLKPGVDAEADVGTAKYSMYTQNDGAWIKNAAEEAQMVEAMRKGTDMIVHGVSTHGTKTTDTYSLKGISQALDRVAQECQ